MSMGATLRLECVAMRTFRAESNVKIVRASSGHPAHPTVLFKVVFFNIFLLHESVSSSFYAYAAHTFRDAVAGPN
jgi:hypothetical protein